MIHTPEYLFCADHNVFRRAADAEQIGGYARAARSRVDHCQRRVSPLVGERIVESGTA